MKDYVYVVEEMVETREEGMESYGLLCEEEGEGEVNRWNGLAGPYGGEERIVREFEGEVEEVGDQGGLECEDVVVCYEEVNEGVNQVGDYLGKNGFEKGMKAALLFEGWN
ncbi:hypothetical protein, partial [Bacillus sp. WP8]|uniref:hypothetical protein n=1 Tax=Bacillus sp. WP8 TaxID=756828 RepID=UPI00119D5951